MNKSLKGKVMDKDYFPGFPTEEEYVRVKDLRSAVEGLKKREVVVSQIPLTCPLCGTATIIQGPDEECLYCLIDKWLKCWDANEVSHNVGVNEDGK